MGVLLCGLRQVLVSSIHFCPTVIPCPAEPPPVMAYIQVDPSLPRKPHYPPCILPGSCRWSVNATSSTPCCLWELSPCEGERRGGRAKGQDEAPCLSPSLVWCRLPTLGHPLWIKSLWPLHVLVPNMKACRNEQTVDSLKGHTMCWYLKNTHTHFQQTIFLVLFVKHDDTPQKTLITWHRFVTPVLIREIAAILTWNIIPVPLFLASATGDSLWINEMSAEMSRLYPLNLSKKKKTTSTEELI